MADICVDFDGTCVIHEYPKVGADVPGCVDVLKRLVSQKHRLILFTMRSNEELEDAVKWFMDREIPLSGVNINPDQATWTTSRKSYGHHYIDDAAVGCPIASQDKEAKHRPYVNWYAVELLLEKARVLLPTTTAERIRSMNEADWDTPATTAEG